MRGGLGDSIMLFWLLRHEIYPKMNENIPLGCIIGDKKMKPAKRSTI